MTIGTIQICGGNGAATATVTTPAFTPNAAGMRLFAFIGQRGSSEPNPPLVSDSTGLTWTKRLDTDTTTTPRMSLWTADVVTPTSMTVTADRQGASVVSVHVIGLTGTANDFTNFASDDDAAGDPSLTLPSLPAASSTVIACVLMGGGNTITPAPTGYTNAIATSTGNRVATYYDQASAAQTLTWTTANADAIALAVELKEATTAAYTLPITVAAFVASAQPIALRANRRLVVGAGSFITTTQPIGLISSRKLPVGVGAFVASAQPIALRANRRLVIDPGSFVITTQPIGLSKGRRLTIDTASFIASGQDISLKRTYRLSIATGSFVVTMQPIALTISTTIDITIPIERQWKPGKRAIDFKPSARITDFKPGVRAKTWKPDRGS